MMVRWIAVIALFVSALVAKAQTDLSPQARAFLSALNADQKGKALFAYDNDERLNWNFVPTSRKGLSFGEMSAAQKSAAMELLKATLSDQGFRKANGVFELEAVLREVEGRPVGDNYRDQGKYYVSLFGEPSATKLWGWRVEGHHISINVTSEGGAIVALTPSFFGANPAIVPSGSQRGKQSLKEETVLGFEMINSLREDQRRIARFSDRALPEIVSGNSRKAESPEPRGIFYSDMDAAQQQLFLKLLDVFVKNYELDFSKRLMTRITNAGMDKLSFAWAGSLDATGGNYYRIQGPTLLIEYDNTQTNANHVHTAVRDLTNDFASDILREHYEKEHK
jgi:hypothetical protein